MQQLDKKECTGWNMFYTCSSHYCFFRVAVLRCVIVAISCSSYELSLSEIFKMKRQCLHKQMSANHSKHFIQCLHEQRVLAGASYDQHEHQMVQIFGGIDQLVTILLQSDALITDKQLENLYNIINNPITFHTHQTKICNHPNKIEDKGLTKHIEYTFTDTDSIAYSIFSETTATRILNILKSKLLMGFLIITAGIMVILYMFKNTHNNGTLHFVSYRIVDPCALTIAMVYVLSWLLYTNKIAMKLLITQFEFWFKMFYGIIWIVATFASRDDSRGDDWMSEILLRLNNAICLYIVLILDAINFSTGTKLLLSAGTCALFINWTSHQGRIAYFEEYREWKASGIVKIANIREIGEIEVSLHEVAYNAGTILTIFILRQIFLLIITPNKSLLISKRALFSYDKIGIDIINIKSVVAWKLLCMLYWLVCGAMYTYYLMQSNVSLEIYILRILLLLSTVIGCISLTVTYYISKYNWTLVICCIVWLIVSVPAQFLYAVGIPLAMPLLGLGITGNYMLIVCILSLFVAY